MKNQYEQAFSELLNLVRGRKEIFSRYYQTINESLGSLFCLGDKQFGLYSSMVRANECSAVKAIETIALSLFIEGHFQNYELYPVDGRYRNLELVEQAKSRPFQIVLTESNRRTGVIFTLLTDARKHCERFRVGEYSIDSLQTVILAEPDDFAYDTNFKKINELNEQTGIAIKRITLREFWERHFGAEEYRVLKAYVDDFNRSASEIIGFQTILSPTDEAILHFKEKIGEELRNYPYIGQILNGVDPLQADINSQQMEIMTHNYLDRCLWRAMVGKCDFAISFITSEWNYKVYQMSERLDLTGVVAGYIKSIEQLLFAIFELVKDTGITILSKDKYSRDSRVIPYTTEHASFADTTLGALEQAISHNRQMLDINEYARKYLVSVIRDWREKQRNGYFHKDNLQSVVAVNEIREKAILLYFLILGSCTIRDEQLARLGIE